MKTLSLLTGMLVLAIINPAFSQTWDQTGNAITTSSRLGSTNGLPLKFITNNVERMRVDTSGRVSINFTTPLSTLAVVNKGSSLPNSKWIVTGSPIFSAFGENVGGNADFIVGMAGNAFNFRPTIMGRRSRGTLNAPLAVQNNDQLTSFTTSGYDGTNFQIPAAVEFYVDGTPTAGSVPARISFVTGSNGATRAERLKITNTGNFAFNVDQMYLKSTTGALGMGTTAPNNSSILDINSTTKGVLFPRMTMAQRDAITSPATGLLIYQTDNDSGYYYYSGAWKPLAPSTAGYANTSLSNLTTPTAVNVDLLPDSTGTKKSLGSVPYAWQHLYLNGDVYIKGVRFVSQTTYDNNFFGSASGSSLVPGPTSGVYNTGVGAYTLELDTTGSGNTATGYSALTGNTSGSLNSAHGMQALSNNNTGNYNTANGAYALQSNNTGSSNTANGYQSMYTNTVGNNNTASGYQSLYSNTNAFYNTASGYQSLYRNTEGYENNATGSFALYNNVFGHDNTCVGHSALFSNTDGSYNTAVGAYSLNSITTNQYNTAIGRQAMSSNPGYENTACGESSGTNNSNQSCFLGSLAGASAGVNNATAIGYFAQATASNMVKVGNTSVTSIGGYVGWTTYPSDSRFKKNVKENVPGLSFINKLRPVTYNVDVAAIDNTLEALVGPRPKDRSEITQQEKESKNNKANIEYTGFIAQEVESAAKEVNYNFSGIDAPKNGKDFYGLRYAEFVVPLVKAVQELSAANGAKDAKMEMQQKKIEAQEKVNADLQKQIDELKAALMKVMSDKAPCVSSK